jgi:hypothetical protein
MPRRMMASTHSSSSVPQSQNRLLCIADKKFIVEHICAQIDNLEVEHAENMLKTNCAAYMNGRLIFLRFFTHGEVECFAQKRHDCTQLPCCPNQGDVRDTVAAGSALDEVRCAHLAAEVNHDPQRIPHYRQVRKDARRPEKRVPITCYYLHVAKALYRALKLPVEIGKRRRPAFEQGCSTADTARVALIGLTKRSIAPRTRPTHKVFDTRETYVCQGLVSYRT